MFDTTGSTGAVDGSAGGGDEATGGSSAATGASGGSDGTATTGATGVDPGEACPQSYAAVCGKDGETYDNACIAEAAGVEIRREGPCVGDCEGSCVVAPRAPSLLALVLVLVVLRPRGRRAPVARARG